MRLFSPPPLASPLPALAELPGLYSRQQQLLFGDFNLHNPAWDPYGRTHHQSAMLLDLAAEHGLELATPPSILT